uniref:Cytochrome P450 n=1 Tax=Rhinopithecus bieti TaxID=61621 RepID=A0A2K6MRP3_RHIBE
MGLDALVPLAMTVAIFLLLVDLMHRRQRWAARYPPGPLPLPGLGNLLHVDFKNTPYCFHQVREEVLEGGRGPEDPPPPANVVVGGGGRGQGVFLAHYGPAWREQRRFSVSTLRNLGLGKKSLEQWVTEEAACLCAAFADQAGCPFRPNGLLDKAASNVIASLTCGCRFEYDDPRFLRLLDLAQEGLKEESSFLHQVLNAVPLLLRIPALAGKVLPSQKAFLTQLDELLTEHRMTWDPAQPPRDLTDAFLAEMEKAKKNPESSFNEENLRLVVADLFSAGMVTTSTTLAWGLLLMVLHPDVQRESSWGRGWSPECWPIVGMHVCPGRVQQEIDDVIGQVQRPEMGDQARMPYTTAVIHEVQRFGDIVPLNVPHMTSRDIEVQGFLIPKGTTLFTNLSSVLKDEAVWEKPFRFHPEHFLDAQGHFVKPEAFLPFSAGRRACLGEPLARMELFLFFTCLLQRFSFSVPPGQPRPSHSHVVGFLVTPSPYELCAVPR